MYRVIGVHKKVLRLDVPVNYIVLVAPCNCSTQLFARGGGGEGRARSM